jgi:hypothetical protein
MENGNLLPLLIVDVRQIIFLAICFFKKYHDAASSSS